MTAQEKRLDNVLKRCNRTLEHIEKEFANLELARDKISTESPEYILISRAMGSFKEAKSDLAIVVSRIKNRCRNDI